jgi:hypothetical protein
VQHEGLLLLAFKALQALPVVRGAERSGHQGLRLAAGKQRRPVRARQNAGFDADLTNFVKRAAIRTNAILGNLLAEDPLAHQLVIGAQLLLGIRIVGWEILHQLRLDVLDEA